MKKKSKVMAIAAIAAAASMALTGCSKEWTVKDILEFDQIVTDAGFEVDDITDLDANVEEEKDAFNGSDGSICYYNMDSIKSAMEFYDDLHDEVEDNFVDAAKTSTTTEEGIGNHQYYTADTDSEYIEVIRVQDIVITVYSTGSEDLMKSTADLLHSEA